MSDMTASEIRREFARLLALYRRLVPTDQGANDVDRIVNAAVAEEQARCAGEVRKFLSPRAGIMLARHPEDALKEILAAIEGEA